MPKHDPLRPIADIARQIGDNLARAEAFWEMGRKPPQASQSEPGKETVNLSHPSTESTREAAVIDYQALAESLLRENQTAPSKLVKFMEARTTASFEEISDGVLGGYRADSTIRGLVNRTNNLLSERSLLRFSTRDSHVIRHIPRE